MWSSYILIISVTFKNRKILSFLKALQGLYGLLFSSHYWQLWGPNETVLEGVTAGDLPVIKMQNGVNFISIIFLFLPNASRQKIKYFKWIQYQGTLLVQRYIFPIKLLQFPCSSIFFLFACHVTLNSSEGSESSCYKQLLYMALPRPLRSPQKIVK